MDTAAQADQIREMGGQDFSDPQDVHDTVSGMHELVSALQDAMTAMASQLEETGVNPAYWDAIHEAAGQMAGIADTLASITSGGVMRGPGG